MLADEHALARDAIRMVSGAGAVLVERRLRCKAAVTGIALPIRLGGGGLMGRAVVDVLDVPGIGVEPTVAGLAE